MTPIASGNVIVVLLGVQEVGLVLLVEAHPVAQPRVRLHHHVVVLAVLAREPNLPLVMEKSAVPALLRLTVDVMILTLHPRGAAREVVNAIAAVKMTSRLFTFLLGLLA